MLAENRLKRLHFRAHHRGTKEADLIIGGFFDSNVDEWNAPDIEWFEALMDEEDADILSWVLRQTPPPPQWDSPLMAAMQRLDYVRLPS